MEFTDNKTSRCSDRVNFGGIIAQQFGILVNPIIKENIEIHNGIVLPGSAKDFGLGSSISVIAISLKFPVNATNPESQNLQSRTP